MVETFKHRFCLMNHCRDLDIVNLTTLDVPLEHQAPALEHPDDEYTLENTWLTFGIVILYLLLVKKWGPEFMKDRKPLEIKPIILVYDIVMVLLNAWILQKCMVGLKATGVISHFHHSCYPPSLADHPVFLYRKHVTRMFYVSKVLDLFDTLFFVLRKKDTHVTFLHVYHHATMVLSVWIFMKFIKDELGSLPTIINLLIHTIMYSYYFLAALGPQLQKYLWWKKYLTSLQMIQFVIVITYYMMLIFNDCKISKPFMLFLTMQVVTFLVLFARFFINTYIMKPKKSIEKSKDK